MRRALIALAFALLPMAAHAASALPTVQGTQGRVEAIPVFKLPALTRVTASSGNVANASAVATLATATTKTTYITGFQCTASGSTSGAAVIVAVTGLPVTQSYIMTFPIGAIVGAAPLVVAYDPPLPATAVNTTIVVTMPAGGSGNDHAACSAQGFQLF